MTARQLSDSSDTDVSAPFAPRGLVLRTPPNWTAVWFFAFLGGLHLVNAISAFYHGRYEAFLSLIFGVVFSAASLLCWLISCDMTIEPRNARIRLRTGYRGVGLERFIPFENVHGVRLLMMPGKSPDATRIEVLCDNEDLQCPPTDIPRQEALCLAMTMNVRLIKVFADDAPESAERLDTIESDRI